MNENIQNNLNKKEKNRKDNILNILKTLGELFIEFFWFIHELLNTALIHNNNGDDRKIVYISLSNKNYNLKNEDTKDKENEIVLKLSYSDIIIYELNRYNANRLKIETTRALYYLLNESKELFVFDEHIPLKIN